MKFKVLAEYLQKLEDTSSRIEITEILSDLFKKSNVKEIDKICYLTLGKLAPSYRSIIFNVAEKMMLRVISSAYGMEENKVKEEYKKRGDMGNLTFFLAEKKKTEKKETLSVNEIYEEFVKIAKDEGEGSQERKVEELARIIKQLDSLSAKFVARIPIGKLRLGFSDKTILDALSWMENGDKTLKNELERAYNVLPDVGLLAKEVKEKGAKKASKNITPVIGVPLLSMLAQRLKSPKEMIEKMGEVSIEPKFDGLRIQIHYSRKGFNNGTDRKVKAFTRNLNEVSWMFPELKDVEKYIKGDEIILDSEAVGVDKQRRSLADFQTTMIRRRKHDIDKIASKIKIRFNVFDIMSLNKKSLINEPYIKRREILSKAVKDGDLLKIDEYEITKDPKRISELMNEELKEGMEGILVKRANSEYVAGRTGWRWVKMKEREDSRTKLADTIDCIVMGYYAGKGKRTKFGIGGFLVGIPVKNKIPTLTKIGTGLTDAQFRELKKRLIKLETKQKPKEYGKVDRTLTPDIWVEPSLVVEIAADEITKSPIHSSGYALRFPRLINFRDDKNPEEASTLKELKKLYKLQGRGVRGRS